MNVCADCFDDPGIRQYILDEAVRRKCSFCKIRSGRATTIEFDALMEFISESIWEEYDDAANCLPYDSGEGGYQGATYTTYELLIEELTIELPRDKDRSLLRAMIQWLGDQTWCDARPFSLNQFELLDYSWNAFSEFVKHHSRFFFFHAWAAGHDSDDEYLKPAVLLKRLIDGCLELGLRTSVPAGTRFWRARFQTQGKTLSSALDLGPPPPERAVRANRMNPPGIPMLYLANDHNTALIETAEEPATFALAEFEVRREVNLIDLTRVDPTPGMFESAKEWRHLVAFLNSFRDSITQPLSRDSRVHTEYVPSQVITEYVRTRSNLGLDGIAYPSSHPPGGECYVLFATRADLVLSHEEEKELTALERWARDKEGSGGWIELVSAATVEWPGETSM